MAAAILLSSCYIILILEARIAPDICINASKIRNLLLWTTTFEYVCHNHCWREQTYGIVVVTRLSHLPVIWSSCIVHPVYCPAYTLCNSRTIGSLLWSTRRFRLCNRLRCNAVAVPDSSYLRQGSNVFAGFCLSVCLSVCQQHNSKSYGLIFQKFWGYVGHGINYQWFNFGRDPVGILDSGSLWNFRYHCVKGGISETAGKAKMVTPPGE